MATDSPRKAREWAVSKLYTYEITNEFEEEDAGEYAIALVKGVLARKEEIDNIIENSLVNYRLSRLNYVDASIIRVATFEMLEGKKPIPVIIDEALEITKKYSNLDDDKAKSFNNRLLDNIYHTIKGE